RLGHFVPYTGQTLWQDQHFGRRVSLTLSQEFNPDTNPPPSITIFIPGWISTLDGTHDASYNINGSPTRTPPTGQNVPGQFTASGVNGLLIVPEMAVNARLSDPGRFRDPQFLAAFLTEALQNAARMHIPGDDNDSDIRTRRERFVQQMMRSEVP